jgi:hypothetical protein
MDRESKTGLISKLLWDYKYTYEPFRVTKMKGAYTNSA